MDHKEYHLYSYELDCFTARESIIKSIRKLEDLRDKIEQDKLVILDKLDENNMENWTGYLPLKDLSKEHNLDYDLVKENLLLGVNDRLENLKLQFINPIPF